MEGSDGVVVVGMRPSADGQTLRLSQSMKCRRVDSMYECCYMWCIDIGPFGRSQAEARSLGQTNELLLECPEAAAPSKRDLMAPPTLDALLTPHPLGYAASLRAA